MTTLRKDNRLLQLAYWPNNPPPETSACEVAGLVAFQVVVMFPIIGVVVAMLSPVLLWDWILQKRSARSNPEKHRRKPRSAFRLCPWKIRVAGARNASKCDNRNCICHGPPKRHMGLGWYERFHCPQCGKAREYGPRKGLHDPCSWCE